MAIYLKGLVVASGPILGGSGLDLEG